MAGDSAAVSRVFLHVGLPKTGTSFVQSLLRQHRVALRAGGLLYPDRPSPNHFLAALDVRGNSLFGGVERPAAGAWQQVLDQALGFPGDVVISSEILATASVDRAQAALASLESAQVHVVVTARDPARQIVSGWQQLIKHGRQTSLENFTAKLLDDGGRLASGAWKSQALPDVLARWGSSLDPTRVHVVTLPPPGSEGQILWQRFAGLLGLDPDAWDTSAAARSNPSLGMVETELLRQVNISLADRLAQPAYGRIVRELYANRILAAGGSAKPRLPAELLPACLRFADEWVDYIRSAGYDVVGELEDLRPTWATRDPLDETPPPTFEQLASAAIRASAELLLHTAQRVAKQRHQPGGNEGRRGRP